MQKYGMSTNNNYNIQNIRQRCILLVLKQQQRQGQQQLRYLNDDTVLVVPTLRRQQYSTCTNVITIASTHKYNSKNSSNTISLNYRTECNTMSSCQCTSSCLKSCLGISTGSTRTRSVATRQLTTNNIYSIAATRTTVLKIDDDNKRSLSTKTSLNNNKLKQILQNETDTSTNLKPMTIVQRIKFFMNGIKLLYNDYIVYTNIVDASTTKRNTWNNQSTTNISTTMNNKYNSNNNNIPRRQYKHLQNFKKDLYKVLPTVVFSMLPIVGYIPILLAVIVPQQLLTYHFWNIYEQYYYIIQTLNDRTTYSSTNNSNTILLLKNLQQQQQQQQTRSIDSTDQTTTNIQSIQQLVNTIVFTLLVDNNTYSKLDSSSDNKNNHHRDYILYLAIKIGILPSLSSTNCTLLLQYCIPTFVLQKLIYNRSIEIFYDNNKLIQENNITSNNDSNNNDQQPDNDTSLLLLKSLTDNEIIQACIERGLPSAFIVSSSKEDSSLSLSSKIHPEEKVVTVDEHVKRILLSTRRNDKDATTFTADSNTSTITFNKKNNNIDSMVQQRIILYNYLHTVHTLQQQQVQHPKLLLLSSSTIAPLYWGLLSLQIPIVQQQQSAPESDHTNIKSFLKKDSKEMYF